MTTMTTPSREAEARELARQIAEALPDAWRSSVRLDPHAAAAAAVWVHTRGPRQEMLEFTTRGDLIDVSRLCGSGLRIPVSACTSPQMAARELLAWLRTTPAVRLATAVARLLPGWDVRMQEDGRTVVRRVSDGGLVTIVCQDRGDAWRWAIGGAEYTPCGDPLAVAEDVARTVQAFGGAR